MPPSSPTIKYEVKDQIAWVTMNRPQAMNAMNMEHRNAIGEAFLEATADDNVFVIIFSGEGGRAFCVGNDLKERAEQDSRGVREDLKYNGMDQVWACPKPIIAAIDGYCLAGGMQNANRCDIRIATEKSRFGMPEPRRSLVAVGGIDTPERFLPRGDAMWVLLTGGHMAAKRAYDVGLIQALVPDRDALFAEAERVANEIKLCAPLAVQVIKRVVKTELGLPTPPEGVTLREMVSKDKGIIELRERIAKSEDRMEGPKAFAEGRAPVWKGR